MVVARPAVVASAELVATKNGLGHVHKHSYHRMPTLEVQLAKAEKDLVAIEKLTGIYPSTWEWGWGSRPNRADTLHGNMAERRGIIQRIRYLQQRLAARNERAARREVDPVLAILEYQSIALPTHTSEPTAPA